MPKVDIKKMELEDIDNISSTLLTEFDDFWTLDTLKSEFNKENSYCYIAKIENEIVGFAVLWKVLDEMHINNIVIKKNLRNMGIGTIFLEHLINETISFKNINSLTLEVNESNIYAQKLYHKHGFEIVGKRKNYYGINQNAIIMTKNII